MPQLHDRTRRKICIAAFFAVCILPTCCLFAWGVSRQGPWHASSYAQRLESRLGLKVSIDDVEHLLPGVVRYMGVRLCDPESGEVVADFHRIDTRRQDVQDRPLPALVLVADSARISPERFDGMLRLLNRVLARRMTRDEVDLRLVIGELKLQSDENNTDGGTTTLRDVRGSLQTVENGSQAEFNFRLHPSSDPDDPAEPIRIHIRRDRRAAPPSICFDIDSRATPLPCTVLALLMPECKSLGPQSRFQGYLFAEKTGHGWQGRIKDAGLTGIDLDMMLGSRFPGTLNGPADLTIHRARFSEGRLHEAAGRIAAGPGTVGRMFFDTVSRQLRLPARPMPAGSNDIPYDKLALNFTVDHSGLLINGTVPGQIEPVILANNVESLLGEPKTQPQPISALLVALAPQNSCRVPADRQIQWLSSLLPLPDSSKIFKDAQSPIAQGQPPH